MHSGSPRTGGGRALIRLFPSLAALFPGARSPPAEAQPHTLSQFLWDGGRVATAHSPLHSPLRPRASLSSGGWDHGNSTSTHPALAHSDPLSLLSSPSSSIWLLLKNPAFVLLCLAGATEATLIAGMSTFGPKFLESQFSLSASEAATLFGENTCGILEGPLPFREFSDG